MQKKGFTLIELLIVLAVIAALLAVVTPIALNAVKRANLTKIASNLRNIKSAAETYVTMTDDDLSGGIEDLLTTLIDDGYLTTSPGDGYSAELTYNDGDITVTIEYSGGDASVEDLQEIYSEVTNVGTDEDPVPGVEFTIKSW